MDKFKIQWIDKYKPNNLDEIILEPINLTRFNNFICGNASNIIISGPYGSGKTSSIHCLTKKILGKYYKDNVMEFNILNDKNINENLLFFCKKSFVNEGKYKIVIIDEIDNFSSKIQQNIGIYMDTYKNTKFMMTCNNSDNIIDSIQSKCLLIRFNNLSSHNIENKLIDICNNEKIKYSDESIKLLTSYINGDLRLAINNLQTICITYNEVNITNVNKICFKPNPVIIKNIIDSCIENNLDNGIKYILKLKKKGYSCNDIIQSMNSYIKNSDIDKKIMFISLLGKTLYNINNGVDSNLQLFGFLSKLCNC